MMVTAFWCAVTQEDQDKVDEDDEREAMQNLVQTWLERLQLISVIVSKAMFYQAPTCLYILSDNILCFD